MVQVCHSLRYNNFYRKVKEILDSGKIGQIASINHMEPVGTFHYAHSFVRGDWNKTAGSPMILAKCCHDMDILSWLLGSRCRTVSSFGDLRYFREENAPAGSPARCTMTAWKRLSFSTICERSPGRTLRISSKMPRRVRRSSSRNLQSK